LDTLQEIANALEVRLIVRLQEEQEARKGDA
jgi:hypothetical protein